jgi:hypothetical protein
MPRGERTAGNRLIGVALGGLGAIAVAVVLVPFRDEIDNTNLALILVLVVVIAAILGGRTAGAVAAVAATLAFDFFLAPPYLSMRLDSADDVETMVILLAVGLLVGEVAARWRRSRGDRERSAAAIGRVQRVAAEIVTGSGLTGAVQVVTTELTHLLRLHDCWLEFPPFLWVLPRLERGGTLSVHEHAWSGGGFALPEDGVELGVSQGNRQIARLVLIGDPTVDVTLEERVVAVALADQLASAFAMASVEEREQLQRDLRRD